MRYTSYPKILAENDTYTTPQKQKRKTLFPTFTFYLKLIRIIFYSNYKTKRNIYDGYNWVASSLDIFDKLEKIGIRFKIEGMKNFQSFEGPCIFISNHMSTLETLILPGIIHPKKPVCFITKKELNDYPFFGPITKARFPIVVGRSNPREDLKTVLNEGKNRLEDGRSIIIFPQKTRGLEFDEKSFNSLGVKLAKANKVHIVPLALYTEAWENGKMLKDFGKLNPAKTVKFSFGEPFLVSGNGAEEHKRVIDFIKSKFNDWELSDKIINS
ncbi:MAG: 1-acyl-sn-glycerol-3-phosphate acyltransferase [Ignavibacteriae bacterium]|nr:1-acyl-sn-glycerol-3-phosphate acyltransferase [Ignavibacteriota bacterium]NOG97484.1 1-acyl-sn-glycerol-3-phosphate acyltransferase [Ignavibacteriota bacterium]